MLTVAIPKRNKLQNIIVLTPKDGDSNTWGHDLQPLLGKFHKIFYKFFTYELPIPYITCLSELS